MNKKSSFIIVRVADELKIKLIKKAGGARKLSALVRSILEENS